MSTFRFQQFSLLQAASAMKVSTDATIFGAMMPLQDNAQVLDIGAGSGLLSLMACQLGAAQVTAVEITPEACNEARHNFQHSPWADRLQAVEQPIQQFAQQTSQRFDLIISNPPFFKDHSRSSDTLRNMARHSDWLPYPELIDASEHLLRPHGLFYLLIPCHAAEELIQLAASRGLHLLCRTQLQGMPHSTAKVTTLTFRRQAAPLIERTLVIYQQHRIYTDASRYYLQHFLLRFA